MTSQALHLLLARSSQRRRLNTRTLVFLNYWSCTWVTTALARVRLWIIRGVCCAAVDGFPTYVDTYTLSSPHPCRADAQFCVASSVASVRIITEEARRRCCRMFLSQPSKCFYAGSVASVLLKIHRLTPQLSCCTTERTWGFIIYFICLVFGAASAFCPLVKNEQLMLTWRAKICTIKWTKRVIVFK